MLLPHDRHGSGPPLVLVHFLGGNHHIWEPVRDVLAASYDTVAVDLPGFGDAPLDGNPTVEAIAARVRVTIDGLGLGRPAVAGISLGGGVALELARQGAASSATAISPIGFGTRREQRWAHRSLVNATQLSRLVRPVAPVLAPIAPVRALAGWQSYGRPWRVPAEDFAAAVESVATAPGMEPTLDEIVFWDFRGPVSPDVPVTILWGRRDALLLPRQGRRAARIVPHARLVELPGCGHIPFYDDREAVVRALLEGVGATA